MTSTDNFTAANIGFCGKCGRTNKLQLSTKPGIGYGLTQQHWAFVLNFNIATLFNSGCGRTQGQFHTCAKPRALAVMLFRNTLIIYE